IVRRLRCARWRAPVFLLSRSDASREPPAAGRPAALLICCVINDRAAPQMPLIAETCVATHRGDRPEQEDRVALFRHPTRSGLLLAVLADGMGGHAGGAMAADQVVIRARQNFEDYMRNSESPREFLGGVLDEAHRVMRLTRFTSEQDPHSTAVLFLLQRDRASWAHCGDPRLYHVRGGRVLHRTEDHSLVGALERSGRIDGEA